MPGPFRCSRLTFLRLPRRFPPRRSLAMVGALALVSVAGCGIDREVIADRKAEIDRDRSDRAALEAWPDPSPPRPRADTSPFAVSGVSDAWTLVAAGPGERAAAWGSPSRGTDRPVTVLAPEADPTRRGVVLVETATPDDRPRRTGSEVEVSGRTATYYRDIDGWDLLVVAVEPDIDLRVWAVDRDADYLGAVALAAAPPGSRLDPPVVDQPPHGLEVVGSLDAEAVVALRSTEPDIDGVVPGPPSAHVLSWVRCDDEAVQPGRAAATREAESCTSLVAMTLPAGSISPMAVVTEVKGPRRDGAPRLDAVTTGLFVGDATAVVTTTADPTTGEVVRRDLVVALPWGDMLLLTSRHQPLSPESLGRVATSISEASGQQWDQMVAQVGE